MQLSGLYDLGFKGTFFLLLEFLVREGLVHDSVLLVCESFLRRAVEVFWLFEKFDFDWLIAHNFFGKV